MKVWKSRIAQDVCRRVNPQAVIYAKRSDTDSFRRSSERVVVGVHGGRVESCRRPWRRACHAPAITDSGAQTLDFACSERTGHDVKLLVGQLVQPIKSLADVSQGS